MKKVKRKINKKVTCACGELLANHKQCDSCHIMIGVKHIETEANETNDMVFCGQCFGIIVKGSYTHDESQNLKIVFTKGDTSIVKIVVPEKVFHLIYTTSLTDWVKRAQEYESAVSIARQIRNESVSLANNEYANAEDNAFRKFKGGELK